MRYLPSVSKLPRLLHLKCAVPSSGSILPEGQTNTSGYFLYLRNGCDLLGLLIIPEGSASFGHFV